MIDNFEPVTTPILYVPYNPADAEGEGSIAVRASNPSAMVPSIREVLRSVDAGVPTQVTLSSEIYRREFSRPLQYAELAGCIASFSFILAITGVLAMTTLAVQTRLREIGVRLALGAGRQRLVASLMRENLRPVMLGLTAGAVLALLAGQVTASLLFGLSPRDPWAIGGAVIVLLVSAASAIAVPVRRASNLDPTVVLRSL